MQSDIDEHTSETQTTQALSTEDNVLNPEDVEWNGDKFEALNNDGLVNILLIGQDRREGESRQRSDAMILCSFNPENNKLSMISFLRDLYVQIRVMRTTDLTPHMHTADLNFLKKPLN